MKDAKKSKSPKLARFTETSRSPKSQYVLKQETLHPTIFESANPSLLGNSFDNYDSLLKFQNQFDIN